MREETFKGTLGLEVLLCFAPEMSPSQAELEGALRTNVKSQGTTHLDALLHQLLESDLSRMESFKFACFNAVLESALSKSQTARFHGSIPTRFHSFF